MFLGSPSSAQPAKKPEIAAQNSALKIKIFQNIPLRFTSFDRRAKRNLRLKFAVLPKFNPNFARFAKIRAQKYKRKYRKARLSGLKFCALSPLSAMAEQKFQKGDGIVKQSALF